MQMQAILSPEAVIVGARAKSKKRLFGDIASLGEKILGVPGDRLRAALIEREELGTTAMGGGVAIPHARVDGISKVCGAFIRLGDKIDFEASDRRGVDLVFALFAPRGAGSEHLKALAKISRVLRDDGTRAKLRSTEEVDAIYAILTGESNSAAA